jgi:soluble lytic murein transglycosylase-like protein
LTPLRTVCSDVGRGLFVLTHSGLVSMGVAVALLALALSLRPDWLDQARSELVDWLRERQVLLAWLPENTVQRVTATPLEELPPAQARVADWLARKYRIAPEPMAALVAQAHEQARRSRLKPHLILAVMAVESSFHPYAQSPAGAQGLMQVMTGIHARRYESFGGTLAAFDPQSNLHVGVDVLLEAIRLRGGSLEDGLLFYLGGDAVTEDGGYIARVREEQARLDQVADGIKVAPQ